jgi:hypothetical protein
MIIDNWAVVWSDKTEIEKITDASADQLKKLKERITAGELSLKLPFIEYSTGHVESKLPLDYERETTLINSLKPLSGVEFSEELHKREPFRPFVAMLEGKFILPYSAPKMFRCRWDYLKQSCLIGEDNSNKIDSILKLPDWELEDQFEKGDNGPAIAFDRELIKEATLKNPNANSMVTAHMLEKKPVNMLAYEGTEYLILALEKTAQPPAIHESAILFPEASRGSIPNSSEFYGRVIGVVNVIANPPKLFTNFILRSVILALPIRY